MSGFKGYPPLTRSAKKLAMSTTPIPIDKVLAGPAPVEHETRVLVLRGCEFFDDLTSAELNTHGRRRGELKSKRARIVHHPRSTTAE